MDTTPILQLPLIMPSQAQAHITHNEALMVLDGITQLAACDRHVSEPPASAAQGERYLIPSDATGAWSGKAGQIAMMLDGAWRYVEPRAGWRCWVENDEAELVHDGNGWIDAATASLSLHDLPGIGINGAYDETTPFAVHGEASLMSGSQDHRLMINKGAAANTASLVFQTAYSGRAEFGTAGDDDFHLKVSADGMTWKEAMVISGASGAITFPNTSLAAPGRNLLMNPCMRVNQRDFPGGALAADTYGFDRWKAGGSGASVSASSGLVTLTSGEIVQPLEAAAFGFPGFAGLTVVFSIEDLSGDLRVTVGSAYHDFAAGSGRQSATFEIPGGHSGALAVKLAPLSEPVTYRAPKLEAGETATPFQENPLTAEELLCFRYFWKLRGNVALFLYAQGAANYFFNSMPLPVVMRQTPTVTRTLGTYGNLYGADPANAMASGLSVNAIRLSIRSAASGECYANFENVTCNAEI